MNHSTLASQLSVYIITYNRCEKILQTLDNFICNSSLHITVLDNCSTDRTESYVQDRVSAFGFTHRLTYIRHPVNIGADANNLRAIELSITPYTWIICDDDIIDLTKMEDVWDNICNGLVDAVSIGVNGHPTLPPGCHRILWDSNPELSASLLLHHTFTPAGIFRTEIAKEMLRPCLKNLNTLFPQFPLWNMLVTSDHLIYVSADKPITKGHRTSYSQLEFIRSWIICSKLDVWAKIRNQIIHKVVTHKTLLYAYLVDQKNLSLDYKYNFCKLIEELEVFNQFRALWFYLAIPLIATIFQLITKYIWSDFRSYLNEPLFDGDR